MYPGDVEVCAHQSSIASESTASLTDTTESASTELLTRYSLDDYENVSQRLPKRRASGDSPVNSIASRFGERFPSLTRRWNTRRTPSMLAKESGRISISGGPSSRSSSMTGSMFPHFDTPSETCLPPSPARSFAEEEEYDMLSTSPDDISTTILTAEEPIDREALASTPLLPPMMLELRSVEQTPLQSPLQSPTIAEANATFSAMNSPLGTPQVPGVPTPPLSTKPSVASFKHNRPGHMVPSSEIPPMTIEDPQDEWALKLGHANFTIFPEPYEPDVCDAAACREVFANWEQARRNFIKHQVRTGEHFGLTSKTYMLTEQKWAQIDAEWKRCYEVACAQSGEAGSDHEDEPTPSEPAPIVRMPSLNGAGKFPKLGDEDIVGPMIQATKQPSPSKKMSWMRVFNELRFPGSFLGRTSSMGTR
ncbi:hypothetical protein K490DRAFT_45279 [Saccharata proteae CBS 121410]|uniref:Only prolin and serin are matching in the corresponding protein n=1 Tax=Saccharata proteae CBS 121410 TaxID=1314787 RepID=A0A9P4LYD9_9PEZI|nr:hypothetical protein K490DRAFT_45279 [Saccharata proteae CBS 121410]